MAKIATDLKPTIVAADNAGNDTDYAAWVKVQKLLDALGNGQLQGGKNLIDNGAFEVWQRGPGPFASGAQQYYADRWKGRRPGSVTGGTVSRQAGFSGARYCARVARDAGDSSTAQIYLCQAIESAIAAGLAGKTIIVSADIRAGADFSAASMNVDCMLSYGTGTDETLTTASSSPYPTGGVLGSSNLKAITTSAQRIEWAATAVNASATEIAIQFRYTPAGTAGAADYFEVTNIQLEICDPTNPHASPYEPSHLAVTIANCERVLQKSFALATTPAQNVGVNTGEFVWGANQAGATAQRSPMVPFRTRMRAAPTLTLYNPAAANAQVRDETASADCSSAATANASEVGFRVTATGNASTAIAGALGVHWLASAEL